MRQRLLYGKEGLEITLPDTARIDVVEPKYEEGLPDQTGAVRKALEDPIDSLPLADLVENGTKVGIVLNDITRATPYHVMLPPLLEILESKGAEVILLNATGTHRTNTDKELAIILGEEIFGKYSIVQNECRDEDSHTYIGTTSRGNEVRIHSKLLECDLKILTGFIEPHFFAGYSGGGKAIMPGLAQLSTVEQNHSVKNIDDDNARWDTTEGNPIWEDVHEAAEMVDGVFLYNVAMNRDKHITGVFAGNLKKAHKKGVRHVHDHSMAGVKDLYDVVITGNSGYPLDLNMYQSVKGMSAAYQIVKEGGDIILAADCWDGIPSHGSYGTMLKEAEDPPALLEKIAHGQVPVQDRWQAQIHAKICERTRVHYYSDNLSDEEIKEAFMVPVRDIGKRVEEIMNERMQENEEFRICVLPQGPLTIPYHEES